MSKLPVAGARRLLLVATLVAVGSSVPYRVVAQGSDRVRSLLQQMTQAEKLSFLAGSNDPQRLGQAGYIPGVPRLGIPPLRLTDGPAGVRVAQPATAMPAPVALASTFAPALAERFGRTVGQDGLALRQDVLLAPMVNIVRTPLAGRNFETLGEDPFLAARMVSAEVRGVQDAGLVATVKHYVANNFENGRHGVDAVVSERALREIYLPGFEAALKAGAGSVMCAYNKVNGEDACDHPWLLDDVLRGEWGFGGWVMTDWGAHHGRDALEHGLDQEMPRAVFFGDSLEAAVAAGRVPQAAVDTAVARILAQMERFGLLGAATRARPERDVEANAAVAREIAEAGAVLLKNDGGLLPLALEDLASVVVIGPTARQPLVGGGGSARVRPLGAESAVEVLRRRAGRDVAFAPGIDLDGVPVPTEVLTTGSGEPGLRRETDAGATQVDPGIDFTGASRLPGGEVYGWTGMLTAPSTGDYVLRIQSSGGASTLEVDGDTLLRGGGFFGGSLVPTVDGLTNSSATLHLQGGRPVPVHLELDARGRSRWGVPDAAAPPVQLRLAWTTPERRDDFVDEAVRAARSARTVVLYAHNEGTEGRDRASLTLPLGQDALIEAVADANARTVVVLNTGDPVTMPWIDGVAAVLEMWYPGQEGAAATTDLLLGDATPGGKLPVTFPRADADAPTDPRDRYPGVEGRARYDEDILVGYRWYDEEGIEPLFPFGHGLSYTTFAYSELSVREADDGLAVSFMVRNAGNVAGAEVPQVYLGRPAATSVAMAPKALVGFERVVLAPGESTRVEVHVGRRELSYWSTSEHGWVVAEGRRRIMVGSSSVDVRLTGDAVVRD